MGKRQSDPQAESLGFWVFRLHRAMHSAFTQRLSKLGVTGAEWAVLARTRGDEPSPVALAQQMGIDRAAVTRIVDRLEEKGLVRRTSHSTDGRRTIVAITEAGESLFPKLVAASRETNREFMKLLPPEDARLLLDLLRKIGERLPLQTFPVEACDE